MQLNLRVNDIGLDTDTNKQKKVPPKQKKSALIIVDL